jgi:hypothetical protein
MSGFHRPTAGPRDGESWADFMQRLESNERWNEIQMHNEFAIMLAIGTLGLSLIFMRPIRQHEWEGP